MSTSNSETQHQPKQKVQSIEEIKQAEKTTLEHSYTVWALMKKDKYEKEEYESVLKAIAHFGTVTKPAAFLKNFIG